MLDAFRIIVIVSIIRKRNIRLPLMNSCSEWYVTLHETPLTISTSLPKRINFYVIISMTFHFSNDFFLPLFISFYYIFFSFSLLVKCIYNMFGSASINHFTIHLSFCNIIVFSYMFTSQRKKEKESNIKWLAKSFKNCLQYCISVSVNEQYSRFSAIILLSVCAQKSCIVRMFSSFSSFSSSYIIQNDWVFIIFLLLDCVWILRFYALYVCVCVFAVHLTSSSGFSKILIRIDFDFISLSVCVCVLFGLRKILFCRVKIRKQLRTTK